MTAYPTTILSWTQRVNGQTVWAADPNALAAEIDAVEQYVGVNPQVESSAVAGATSTFSSMSARLSDAMLQRGHPFIQVGSTTGWNVYHNVASSHTSQNPDSTTLANWPNYIQPGGRVIIRDSGLWLINAWQRWQPVSSGWVMMELMTNGGLARRSIFSYNQFPASGSNTYGERGFGLDGHTEATFMGRLNAGTVITVTSGNFTNVNPIQVQGSALSLYWLRP